MIPIAKALAARIAFNVRRLRLARRRTLEVASGLAGLAMRHWQKVEAGVNNIELTTLEAIAAALEVDVTELLRHVPADARHPPRRPGTPFRRRSLQR